MLVEVVGEVAAEVAGEVAPEVAGEVAAEVGAAPAAGRLLGAAALFAADAGRLRLVGAAAGRLIADLGAMPASCLQEGSGGWGTCSWL